MANQMQKILSKLYNQAIMGLDIYLKLKNNQYFMKKISVLLILCIALLSSCKNKNQNIENKIATTQEPVDSMPIYKNLNFDDSIKCFGKERQYTDNSDLWVIKQNKVGRTYCFYNKEEKYDEMFHLTYLGKYKQSNKKTIKLLTTFGWHGQSFRGFASIFVFVNEKFIGCYNVFYCEDLPLKFENGELIFTNLYNKCNPELVTKISFKDSIPDYLPIDCVTKNDSIRVHSFIDF